MFELTVKLLVKIFLFKFFLKQNVIPFHEGEKERILLT